MDISHLSPDKQARVQEILKKQAELLVVSKNNEANNRCYFYRPYPWQERVLAAIKSKKTVLVIAPNKIGKTITAINIAISWVLGFEPWSKLSDDLESGIDGVKVPYGISPGVYAKSSLGIAPPVVIRIVSEDWEFFMGKVIVPELKKWAPVGEYETRKNNVGIEYFWKFKNGSTLELMTYQQDSDLFEGWMGHGVIFSEPPPKFAYSGLSRGIFLSGGKMLMEMTPLKEAWILDEIALSDRPEIGVVDGMSILDNPDLKQHDTDVLVSNGVPPVKVDEYFDILLKWKDTKPFLLEYMGDKYGHAAQELHVERFLATVPQEMREARFFGRFSHLAGLVLKEFNRDVHVIEPFKVPTDWPVVVQIDLHLSKPQAIAFYAVDPHGHWYAIDEVWENMGPEGIADEIIRRKISGLRIYKVEIDPLSKGDNAYIKNRVGVSEDSFTIIKRKLAVHRIPFDVASKDKESGVRNLQEKLKGVNRMPSLFFFNTCKRHLFEINRWVYDENQKPKKENDDFMECLYRQTLMGVKYTDPQDRTKPLDFSNISKGII